MDSENNKIPGSPTTPKLMDENLKLQKMIDSTNAWINSKEGTKAMQDAISESDRLAKADMKRLEPTWETMNERITI